MLTKTQRLEILKNLELAPTSENLLIIDRTVKEVEENIPSYIEGMEVSIDVSTCPDGEDGDRRLFGIVNECMEDWSSKNGRILLVYEAKSNYTLEEERSRFEHHIHTRLKDLEPDLTKEQLFVRLKNGKYQVNVLNPMWSVWQLACGYDLPKTKK